MSAERAAKALERLTFFSDAVFAIAMTLLVIEIRVPHVAPADDRTLVDALLGLLPNYIGFVVSFVVIARFWMGHHRNLGMIVAASPRLVRANLVLLLAVAFMPFTTAVLSDYVQLRAATVFYAVWLVFTGLANMAVVGAAFADPVLVRSDVAAEEVRHARLNCWIPVAGGLAAALAGFVAPIWAIVGLVIVTATAGRLLDRRGRPAQADALARSE